MYLARAVAILLRRGTVWSLHRVLCDANKDQLLALCERKALSWHQSPPVSFSDVLKDDVIRHSKLWGLFASSNILRSGDILMGETGTSGYGVREMRTPPNVRIIAPATWLSIGYMLPAAQSAALAKQQIDEQLNGPANGDVKSCRTILFIGDGSLQMTVQLISTIIRHNLDIIIVVLNNDGYTIERAIHGVKGNYNDIASWRYLSAPHFFGAKEGTFTASARSWGELETVLASKELSEGTGLRMIELVIDREDVPEGPLAVLMGKEKERMEGLRPKKEVIL